MSNVRFGSLADISAAMGAVRFVPPADIAEVVHCLQIGSYTVIAYCAWIH
jgi:hypothetical protein